LNLLKWDFAKKDYHVKAIVRENVTGAAVVIGRLVN
jgi:hypothetical protein